MRKRTTWNEKLNADHGLPTVIEFDTEKAAKYKARTVLVPSPCQVDALMRSVPRGKLITIAQIRDCLAMKHQTDTSCAMTTGIFAWIAAHAAEESAAMGIADTTPYWRTLKSGGELNPKYPGGIDALRARLEAEGHTIVSRGKRFFVAEFEKSVFSL